MKALFPSCFLLFFAFQIMADEPVKTNFVNYHLDCYGAELLISNSKFQDAAKLYDKIFSTYRLPFYKDVQNAAICAIKAKDRTLQLKFAERLVELGYQYKDFDKPCFTSIFENKKNKETFDKNYPSHNEVYNKYLNSAVRQKFIELCRKDRTASETYDFKTIDSVSYKNIKELQKVINDFGFPNIDNCNDNRTDEMQLMLKRCFLLINRIDQDRDMQKDPFYAAMDFNGFSLDSVLRRAVETGRILPVTYLNIVSYGKNSDSPFGEIYVILDFETETTSLEFRSSAYTPRNVSFTVNENTDSIMNAKKQNRAQLGFFPVDERTNDLLKTTWYSQYPFKEIKQNWGTCDTCKNSDYNIIQRDVEKSAMRNFNSIETSGFRLVTANFLLQTEQKNVHKFNPAIQQKANETADNNAINYYIKNYQYESALNILSSRTDKSDEMLRQEASLLSTLKRHEEAIAIYNILYQKDTMNIRTLTDMASSWESLGNYADAQRLLTSAYSMDTTNVILQQRIGDSYYQSENYNSANLFYFKAESNRSTHYIIRQIARCYDRMKQDSLAKIYYQKAIDYNPKDYVSTIKVADYCIVQKDFDSALKTVQNYFQLDSLNLPVIEKYATICLRRGDYDEAISFYSRCLTMEEAKPLVIKNLGYSYLGKQDYESAIPFLATAYIFDPTNADVSLKLGMAFQGNKDYDNAKLYFDETLHNLIPDSALVSRVHHSLSEIAMAQNDYKLSIKELQNAYEQNPKDNISLYEIAVIYDSKLEDKKNALVFYQKFLTSRNVQFDKSVKNRYDNKKEIYEFTEKRIETLKD